MKKSIIIAVALLLLATVSVSADGWKGKSGLGLRGPVHIPLMSGSDFSINGNNNETFMMGWEGTLFYDYGLHDKLVLEFSYGYVSTYDDLSSTSDNSFSLNNSDNAYAKMTGTLLGVSGKYFFSPESKAAPYFIFGMGVDIWKIENIVTTENHWAQDFVLKTGLGLQFNISENLLMGLEGRFSYGVNVIDNNLPRGFYGTENWATYDGRPFRAYLEPSIGFTYTFGGSKDSDKDGVKDDDDACPDTPLGSVVDGRGCPIDSDGDGIFDGFDRCADTPKGAKVDEYGCPLDSDNDGVYDGFDQCPDTPDKAPVDNNGCPLDSDGDGVADYKDDCPDTPTGAVVDAKGCPIDSDQDGYFDGIDKCPRNAIGLEVDETGCPKEVEKITEKITLNINYEPSSFAPDSDAKSVLDGVAKSLKAFPFMTLKINGFTDSQGGEELNQKLSENRANGVMEYLVSQGISADRLTATGFGENPQYFVGDNDTAEGRKANRRVEIESFDE